MKAMALFHFSIFYLKLILKRARDLQFPGHVWQILLQCSPDVSYYSQIKDLYLIELLPFLRKLRQSYHLTHLAQKFIIILISFHSNCLIQIY